MRSYNSLYLETRRALRAAELPMAGLEARHIIMYVSGKSAEQLLRDAQMYVSAGIERKTCELTARRVAGEPLAHILGSWQFCGLEFSVTPDTLIPRNDTETLVVAAESFLGSQARVLDLCTGSGCVGLALAVRNPQINVCLLDISEKALSTARENIRRHVPGGRACTVAGDARRPAPYQLGLFDIIICNPPYIPTEDIQSLEVSVRDYEPFTALDGGSDGLEYYRAVTACWRHALKAEGVLLFELGAGQAERVRRLLRDGGFSVERIWHDSGGTERVIAATAAWSV